MGICETKVTVYEGIIPGVEPWQLLEKTNYLSQKIIYVK